MPIYSEHPEYTKNKTKWKLVRDVQNSNVDDYIIPVECGNSRRVAQRNANYKKRAIFSNFTLNTRLGLVGLAMAQDPRVLLPTGLEYIDDYATGNGLKFDQLVRKLLGEMVDMGRVGILADYPSVPLGKSIADIASLQPHAKMYVYKAEDILNWGITTQSGTEQLNFLVLREEIKTRVDGFEWACAYQYRVLQLDDAGYYYYYVMDHEEKQQTKNIYPKANGKNLRHIPFHIGGSDDNDYEVDPSPMYPIAHVNIGHLRNSASLEDNADRHSQGTLFLTSTLSTSQWKELTDGRPVVMGAGEGYMLGAPGGDAKLLQLGPDQLSKEMMTQKEQQIVMLGGHLITSAAATNAPVETTKMVMGAKLSRMGSIVNNCEDLLNNAIRDCALFEGTDPSGVEVLLSHNFIPYSPDAQIMREILAQQVAGVIPHSVLLDYNRRVDLIPRDQTNEQVIQEIEKEKPDPAVSTPPVVSPVDDNLDG